VYNGNHITALEKVTRKKVGAMAAISSGVLDSDNSASLQQQTQTQTTTTTTTTTLTTATTTTKSCPSSPLITATDPDHPHNNSPVSALDLEKACSKACLSSMSPSIENMTEITAMVNVQLVQEPASGRLLSPAIVVNALTPPISSANTTRSMESAEDLSKLEQHQWHDLGDDGMQHTSETEDYEESVPRLTITHADGHRQDSVSTSAFSKEGLVGNINTTFTSESGVRPSARKRTKSVRGDDFDADQDNNGRGIECDAKAWLEVGSSALASASAPSTISITSTATSSKNGSRNHSRSASEMDREDLEEAKRVRIACWGINKVIQKSGLRYLY